MTKPMKQVVLVTGCSKGGIGYALAKRFALEGNHVIATTRKLAALEGLEEYGCDREEMDINDEESIVTTVQKIIDRLGRIDILVNNAGVPAVGALMDISTESIQQCINTNVLGTLSASKAVARFMIKEGQGKIVNVGSVVGYTSTPWAGIYSLSKAAVHSMSDTLRLELKPFKIQVVVVAPASITSNFGNAGTKAIKIPEDSLYTSVAKYIIARANLSQGASSTSADDFSFHVVNRLLRPVSPRYITYGPTSWMFLALYYLPAFVKDFVFYRKFGVNHMTDNQQKNMID